ncbi:MAG: hypothetical protein CM1200mP29_01430 [Verrucomicrobiota bacterium]|nr:MAG: hypothetical protein CM1200mP29_01430 [Verrucomicrobiota bacterium]
MISLWALRQIEGERLVSARAAMKKMIKAARPHGVKTNQFQPACALAISAA